VGSTPCLLYTILCVVFEARVINLCDRDIATNALPKYILDEMHMLPSTVTARAYDCSPRQVVGTIEMELFIGSQVFFVTLQVMDIHPSYNMLLGRPWIRVVSVVASP
jgi:hypothetical protein